MKSVDRYIARMLVLYPQKYNQLDKIQTMCFHYTSDDIIKIGCELYEGNIIRYVIKGTRCNMTLAYNVKTLELARKPRGKAPWVYTEEQSNCGVILKLARMMKDKFDADPDYFKNFR